MSYCGTFAVQFTVDIVDARSKESVEYTMSIGCVPTCPHATSCATSDLQNCS